MNDFFLPKSIFCSVTGIYAETLLVLITIKLLKDVILDYLKA